MRKVRWGVEVWSRCVWLLRLMELLVGKEKEEKEEKEKEEEIG